MHLDTYFYLFVIRLARSDCLDSFGSIIVGHIDVKLLHFFDALIYNYCTYVVMNRSLLIIRINSIDYVNNFNWCDNAVTSKIPSYIEPK